MTTFFQTLPPLRQLIGEEKAEYEKRLEEPFVVQFRSKYWTFRLI
jgi:hypothetical protein